MKNKKSWYKQFAKISFSLFFIGSTILLWSALIFGVYMKTFNLSLSYIDCCNSMSPTFAQPCLLLNKELKNNEAKVGDIVSFVAITNESYSWVTHRVIGICENSPNVETKGDGNNFTDGCVYPFQKMVGYFCFGQVG